MTSTEKAMIAIDNLESDTETSLTSMTYSLMSDISRARKRGVSWESIANAIGESSGTDVKIATIQTLWSRARSKFISRIDGHIRNMVDNGRTWREIAEDIALNHGMYYTESYLRKHCCIAAEGGAA